MKKQGSTIQWRLGYPAYTGPVAFRPHLTVSLAKSL